MKERFNISLDPVIKEMSVKAAKEKGISFSSLIEGLLRKLLKKRHK